MSKLTDDPKVQAHVEKETSKALKAERKRAADALKQVLAEHVEGEEVSKEVKQALKKYHGHATKIVKGEAASALH